MVAVATFQVPDTYTCAPDTWTQGTPSFLKALLNSSGLEGEATPHGGLHSLWGSGAFYLTIKFLLVFLLVLASFLLQNQVKTGASGFDVRLLGNYGLTETRRPTSLSSQLIRRLLPFG